MARRTTETAKHPLGMTIPSPSARIRLTTLGIGADPMLSPRLHLPRIDWTAKLYDIFRVASICLTRRPLKAY